MDDNLYSIGLYCFSVLLDANLTKKEKKRIDLDAIFVLIQTCSNFTKFFVFYLHLRPASRLIIGKSAFFYLPKARLCFSGHLENAEECFTLYLGVFYFFPLKAAITNNHRRVMSDISC